MQIIFHLKTITKDMSEEISWRVGNHLAPQKQYAEKTISWQVLSIYSCFQLVAVFGRLNRVWHQPNPERVRASKSTTVTSKAA